MDDRHPITLDPDLQQFIDHEIDEHIDQRLHQLEQRVFALEHTPAAQNEIPTCAATRVESIEPAPALETAPAFPIAEPTPASTTAVLPVLGKAVLGFAGAYLLRALEESNLAPPSLIIALAVAYAALWLVLAARLGKASRLVAITYACTSCFILAPMLLELSLRFHLLAPAVAAAILAAFALTALLLSSTRSLSTFFWPPWTTSIALALLLTLATHTIAPFVLALLLLTAAAEAVPIRSRGISARLLAAPALDAVLLLLLFIYTSPASSRPDYPALHATTVHALTLIPFALYAALVALRTLIRRQPIALFDAAQTVATFLIAVAALQLLHPQTANRLTGFASLLLSALCYAALFTRFNQEDQRRNRNTFSLWSATLLLLGSALLLANPLLPLALGLAAIVTAILSPARFRESFRFHTLLYLAAAAYASGLFLFIAHTLTASTPLPATALLLAIAACAVFVYRFTQTTAPTNLLRRIPTLGAATLAFASTAALLVHLAAHLLPTTPAGPRALAQTLITCALTLGLAYVSARTQQRELLWIAYAAIIAIAAKLLLLDTRQDHFAFIAGSFILYAATLIALPRLSAPAR